MNWTSAAALGVAALSVIIAALNARRSAAADWVRQLEARIELCEQDRTIQRQEINTLRAQNYDLMTRMMRLEQGDP